MRLESSHSLIPAGAQEQEQNHRMGPTLKPAALAVGQPLIAGHSSTPSHTWDTQTLLLFSQERPREGVVVSL